MALRDQITLYDSVQSSNLPYETKSALRRWFDTAVSLPEAVRPTRKQVHGTLSAFRQGAESLLAGMALGALNVESPGGLEPAGIPLDAGAGFIFLAGSAIGAESDMAPTARNIGSVCTGVFGMRMATKFLVEKRLSKGKGVPSHLQMGSSISGEVPARSTVADDPIVQAADSL